MHAVLETERMILRRFTEGDTDHLIDLDSEPDVMRFINGGQPTPRDQVERDIQRLISDYDRFPGFRRWAASEQATSEFIGWFSLRIDPGGPAGDPELGYRPRKAVWGNGYAIEGSLASIDKAFSALGAARVLATTSRARTAVMSSTN